MHVRILSLKWTSSSICPICYQLLSTDQLIKTINLRNGLHYVLLITFRNHVDKSRIDTVKIQASWQGCERWKLVGLLEFGAQVRRQHWPEFFLILKLRWCGWCWTPGKVVMLRGRSDLIALPVFSKILCLEQMWCCFKLSSPADKTGKHINLIRTYFWCQYFLSFSDKGERWGYLALQNLI